MEWRRRFQDIVSAILVVCAIAMTGIVAYRQFRQPAAEAPRAVHDWEALALRTPDLGPPEARTRVVLFSDYQCPYCRDLDAKLEELAGRHPGRIAVVRYEYPLQAIHPRAHRAAVAAKCAASQEIRAPFQARLFAADLAAADPDYRAMAALVGVPDLPEFATCLDDPNASREVDADMAIANGLGIDSVPVFIVDGKLYTGTRDMDALEDIVADVL